MIATKPMQFEQDLISPFKTERQSEMGSHISPLFKRFSVRYSSSSSKKKEVTRANKPGFKQIQVRLPHVRRN